MLVFDTSAYINGRRHHLPIETFPSVWWLVSDAMEDGRVIGPRKVLAELSARDDDIYAWAREREGAFLEPTEEVQGEAGFIAAQLPESHTRGEADPWVIAEAKVRSMTVVTYEGQTFAGVPTRRWSSSMPGMCRELGVKVCTLPEALAMLGGSF